MPYVDEQTRRVLENRGPLTRGELNYAITRILNQYIVDKGLNYYHINDVLGALDGASKEFYRRVAEPYEDEKREQNSDVYSTELLPARHGLSGSHD